MKRMLIVAVLAMLAVFTGPFALSAAAVGCTAAPADTSYRTEFQAQLPKRADLRVAVAHDGYEAAYAAWAADKGSSCCKPSKACCKEEKACCKKPAGNCCKDSCKECATSGCADCCKRGCAECCKGATAACCGTQKKMGCCASTTVKCCAK